VTPQLFELPIEEADIAVGSIHQGKIEEGAMPWIHRWIGNLLLKWFLKFFYKARLSDALALQSHYGARLWRSRSLGQTTLGSPQG